MMANLKIQQGAKTLVLKDSMTPYVLRLELGLPMAGDAGKTSVTQPCVGHSSKHR
jgi:hypothetical protein